MTPWDFDTFRARQRRARRLGYVVLTVIVLLALASVIMVGHTLAAIWFAELPASGPEGGQ